MGSKDEPSGSFVAHQRLLKFFVSGIGAISCFLFIWYAYESTASPNIWTGLSVTSGARPGGPVDLAVRLHPENHRSRERSTLHMDWEVSKGWRYPDGVGKWVYLINGEFPCPNIEARAGDEVVIMVHNHLEDEGLALHFHGLHMRGKLLHPIATNMYSDRLTDNNDMDGVVGITQRPIQPGSNHTYAFSISIDQAGTFWWHSHSEMQRADGLYGALIVHKPSGDGPSKELQQPYDEELLLMVGDWYHLPASDVQESYDTYRFWGMEPVPDSLLINGHGAFNCSKKLHTQTVDCLVVPKPHLVLQKHKSRVRIINVGTLSGFNFKTAGNLSVISVDGGNSVEATDSPVSGFGILYPGERIDIIVDWMSCNELEGFIEIELDKENFKRKNLALTTEQIFPVMLPSAQSNSRVRSREILQDDPKLLDLTTMNGVSLSDSIEMKQEPDEIVLVYTNVELLAHLENSPKGFINRTYWQPQESPLIETGRENWDEHQLVPLIKAVSANDTGWVDVVINNVDEKGHPFHLHGYDFYVLSTFRPPVRGWHAYNPFDKTKQPHGGAYNLNNPLKKDTIYIPGTGYAVLRIRPDNPGLWFLHCHILWHQGVGMAMTLQVGQEPTTGG